MCFILSFLNKLLINPLLFPDCQTENEQLKVSLVSQQKRTRKVEVSMCCNCAFEHLIIKLVPPYLHSCQDEEEMEVSMCFFN